ncbi:MAG: 3-hydroxyacyl-CoA dehydrogenase [Mogibacterium sp.]|nr:3-hydroxyacyl-CoA dehydrogenase [Mogibacterium sp.]
MRFKKVVIIGGGVLGTQIGLMSAYTGHDTTLWLRSEGSVGRTQPKVEQYSAAMIADLEDAKKLVGNPMGAFLYPHGLIRSWEGCTVEGIDELIATAKKNFKELFHLELDLAKALEDADIVIEAMAENPEQKIEMYGKMKDLIPEKTILCTNSSTLLPSMFAEYTGRPEKYCALHFANTIWKNNTGEVMGHPGTDPEVYDQVVAFADEINMVPLQLHKEQPGYILNSMLVPFLTAAQALWANEVADPETIDLTWRLATSAPAGPFQILDIVGLTTAYNINQMKPEAQVEGTLTWKMGQLLKEKIDKGETGVTAGKGFYDYTK